MFFGLFFVNIFIAKLFTRSFTVGAVLATFKRYKTKTRETLVIHCELGICKFKEKENN